MHHKKKLNLFFACQLLTFSYSVSDTVERHDIEGIRAPPGGKVGTGTSLATDRAPDEPCTGA